MADNSPSPFEAFLAALRKDIEADNPRPLAEYLARFPDDEERIAEEYFVHKRGGLAAPASDRFAHYRILRKIDRGGQATVYLAEDTRLHRQVALKIMDPGFTADGVALERFRREAEITSKLDHPGICTVYENGEDRGVFWIAMRFVEGESLAKKISTAKDGQASSVTTSFVVPLESEAREDSQPGSQSESRSGPKTWTEIARVLELFEDAARTLHVAHEHGVIHRDIKPGNLIVTKDGELVILDFGLAQEVESDHPTLTNPGDLPGTPAYMSPEQLTAQRIKLDRRTDVYSLGISLYECLALRRPFEAPTREGLYQAILTKEAPDLRGLNHSIPADLRVVVATAIEKDRDRRYQTALDLAEELRRVRMRESIMAKPVGPLVRFWRWAERRPAVAASLAFAFLALSAGLVVSMTLLGETRAERNLKDEQMTRAESALRRADGLRLVALASGLLEKDPGLSLSLALEGAKAHPGTEAVSTVLDAMAADHQDLVLRDGDVRMSLQDCSSDGSRILAAGEDGAARVWDAADGRLVAVMKGHQGPIHCARFSPDGSRVVTGSSDGTARVYDARTGASLLVISGHTGCVESAVFAPAGILTASRDKTAALWDATTGKKIVDFKGHAEELYGAAICAGGKRVVTVSPFEDSRLWDAGTGKEIAVLSNKVSVAALSRSVSIGSNRGRIAVSPDGQRIFSAMSSTVYDAESGRIVVTLGDVAASVHDGDFSLDGARLVTGGLDGSVRLWDLASARQILSLEGQERGSTKWMGVAVHPDGRRVVFVSGDGIPRIWDTQENVVVARLRGHQSEIRDAPFTRGVRLTSTGSRLVTSGWDGTVRTWRLSPLVPRLVHGKRVVECAFSPDGSVVATCELGRTLKLWDARTAALLHTLECAGESHTRIAFSPDGRTIAYPLSNGDIVLHDLKSHEEHHLNGHDSSRALSDGRSTSLEVKGIHFAPDGKTLVTVSDDGTGRVWDVDKRSALRTLDGGWKRVGPSALSADGGVFACLASESDAWTGLWVWKAETGALLQRMTLSRGGGRSIAISPCGSLVLIGSHDGTCELIDIASGKSVLTLAGHSVSVECASFSCDGKWVLTGSADGTAILSDASNGASLRVLRHSQGLTIAKLDGSCRRILTASKDRTARVWDALSGNLIAVLRGHTDEISRASFSPDGSVVLTGSYDGTARLWPIDNVISTASTLNRRGLSDAERRLYQIGVAADAETEPK